MPCKRKHSRPLSTRDLCPARLNQIWHAPVMHGEMFFPDGENEWRALADVCHLHVGTSHRVDNVQVDQEMLLPITKERIESARALQVGVARVAARAGMAAMVDRYDPLDASVLEELLVQSDPVESPVQHGRSP